MNHEQKNTQSRKYQLTINNPEKVQLNHETIKGQLQQCKSLVYFAMADEIGDSNTPHTHIYVAFSSPVRFSTIKRLFPTAHIESANGSSEENRNYILKEGEKYADKAETSVEGTFEEWGEMPVDGVQGLRTDLEIMYQLIKDGESTSEIIEKNPKLIRYINSIEKVRQMLLQEQCKDDFRHLSVTYIFGTTATGKTRYVMEKHGYSSVYRVTDYSHPFDSYKGELIVLFDEFSSSLKIHEMLNLLDGYPLELSCRYANKRALYTEVYIISNIDLTSQYNEKPPIEKDVINAFYRRIHKVIHFKKDGTRVEYETEDYLNGTTKHIAKKNALDIESKIRREKGIEK